MASMLETNQLNQLWVRRKSCSLLRRKKSAKSPSSANLWGSIEEDSNPFAIKQTLNPLHVFSLVLAIKESMKCKLCNMLYIDATALECGHAFCKYCLTKWLKSNNRCPVCRKRNVHPICNRCYQLDAFVDAVYPIILDLLKTAEPISRVQPTVSYNNKFHAKELPDTSVTLLDAPRKENLRIARRRLMRKEVGGVKQCPNKSILEGVHSLGFGLRNTFTGFIIIFIGSVFLALAMTQFSDMIEKLHLTLMKRLLYVFLMTYVITKTINMFQGGHVAVWNQVIKIQIFQEDDPFHKMEKERILELIMNKKVDTRLIQQHGMDLARAFVTTTIPDPYF